MKLKGSSQRIQTLISKGIYYPELNLIQALLNMIDQIPNPTI